MIAKLKSRLNYLVIN